MLKRTNYVFEFFIWEIADYINLPIVKRWGTQMNKLDEE